MDRNCVTADMSMPESRAPDSTAPERVREDFRKALRGVAATVSVVSTNDGAARYGMTATAVMSVSLDPPSLVVAINKAASIHEPLRLRKFFCVNVLAEGHHSVGQHFSLKRPGADRFDTGAWATHDASQPTLKDLPYLRDAQANIFCRLESELSYGSHTLLVGAVLELRTADKIAPLLYCDGAFGSFSGNPGGMH